jgi:hypothetical protein
LRVQAIAVGGRLCLKLREAQGSGRIMPKVVRVPITNIHADGDYTGRIFVGARNKPMNVLLDTGSSMLAISGHKYHPDTGKGDEPTRFAQTESYDDNTGWTGAVIHTSVAIGDVEQVTVADANVGVAYHETGDAFSGADGILGLAYAALDDALALKEETWPKRYTQDQISRGKDTHIEPYLTQLYRKHVILDKVSFYTRRSAVHHGAGAANDPLNQGWMIVGGGEESTDLYSGKFQTAKVKSQEWYNTNLKAVIVGGTEPIHVPKRSAFGCSGNSIVDSGTASLDLGPQLLRTLLDRFDAGKRALLEPSIREGRAFSMSDLDLATWPDITFVLEGETEDITLKVHPGDYWQVNSPRAGAASAAITKGTEGNNLLGLPLMNGYFTIFDGEADHGKGAIRFARIKR